MQRLLRAISWRPLIAHAMTFVLLIAATAPHVLTSPLFLEAQTVAVGVADLDGGQLDPTLPGGAAHHCAQCPCHSIVRVESRVGVAPFSIARVAYAAQRFECPQSLAPVPFPPPPRA